MKALAEFWSDKVRWLGDERMKSLSAAWLKRIKWNRREMRVVEVEWARPKLERLYRIHYAWDPYVSKYSADWALAAVCECDVAHYASVSRHSNVLPRGFAFLTEFLYVDSARFTGDYKHEQSLELRTNPYVPVRLGLLQAVHVSLINRINAGKNDDNVQRIMDWEDRRTWLYETQVIRGHTPVIKRSVVRCAENETILDEAEIPGEWACRASKRSVVATVNMRWSILEREVARIDDSMDDCAEPKTFEEFINLSRSKVFQMSPFEALVYTCLCGFSDQERLREWLSLFRSTGWQRALEAVSAGGTFQEYVDTFAREAFPLLRTELQRHLRRLCKAFGTSVVSPDEALADLVSWASMKAGHPPRWSTFRHEVARAAGETMDRIFGGRIVALGLFGREYERTIFRNTKI